MLYFHDSHVMSSLAFVPRTLFEDQWQMQYRLLLEEKKYAFGLFLSPDGSRVHLGIDEAYRGTSGEYLREPMPQDQRVEVRAVAPILSPQRVRRRHPGAMLVSCLPFLNSEYAAEMRQESREATASQQRVLAKIHEMEQDLLLMGPQAPAQGSNTSSASLPGPA